MLEPLIELKDLNNKIKPALIKFTELYEFIEFLGKGGFG